MKSQSTVKYEIAGKAFVTRLNILEADLPQFKVAVPQNRPSPFKAVNSVRR
jgi:hypothetical protein